MEIILIAITAFISGCGLTIATISINNTKDLVKQKEFIQYLKTMERLLTANLESKAYGWTQNKYRGKVEILGKIIQALETNTYTI